MSNKKQRMTEMLKTIDTHLIENPVGLEYNKLLSLLVKKFGDDYQYFDRLLKFFTRAGDYEMYRDEDKELIQLPESKRKKPLHESILSARPVNKIEGGN